MAYIDILQLNPRTMLWLYTCERCYAVVYGRSEKDCMTRADGHVLWHVGGK